MPNFNMASYTDVNTRMKMARDTWTSITVSPPVMLTDTYGYVMATVTMKDGRTVTETAGFRLGMQGKGAQATFPTEDAATSAVGRALGRFGFGTDDHFPSREEMEQVQQIAEAGYPVIAPKDDRQALTDRIVAAYAQAVVDIPDFQPQTEAQLQRLTDQQLRDELAWVKAELRKVAA